MTTLRAAIDASLAGRPADLLAPGVTALMASYRSGGEPPRLDDPTTVSAYVAYRMPGTHAAAVRVLAATRAAVPTLAPRTVLDLGGGPGALAWAATETFASLQRVEVLDAARAALEAGRTLAATSSSPALAGASWTRGDVTGPWPVETCDLATAGYLLGELGTEVARALVDRMAEAATTVVLIEPGTPAGFEQIREARRRLIAAGLRVAAPCPHDDACPMSGDWCHFSARFERSPLLRRLKGGRHGHDDEKYSYVAATHLPVDRPPARIVRHPVYRKGLVSFEACTLDHGLTPITITRRHPDSYRAARDATWGDAWESRTLG